MLVNVSLNDIEDPAVRRCLTEMQRQINFCIEELAINSKKAQNDKMKGDYNEQFKTYSKNCTRDFEATDGLCT